MKNFLGIFALGLLILSFNEADAVIGPPATIGQFPSQVGIHLPDNRFCGGTLIDTRHVVTAASCVLAANLNLISFLNVQVRVGTLIIPGTTALLAVNAIFVHPTYNPFTQSDNIAVLRLTVPLVFDHLTLNVPVAPATFSDRIVADNILNQNPATCQIAGWNVVANTPSNLNVFNAAIMNRETCNTVVPHIGRIAPSMFCVTDLPIATAGVCATSIGSGLYCNNELVGILSFGTSCNTIVAIPSVYTDIRRYRVWIQQQTVSNTIPVAGPTPHPTFPLNAAYGIKGSMFLVTIITMLSFFF